MAEIQGLVIGFFHTQPDDQLEAPPSLYGALSPFTSWVSRRNLVMGRRGLVKCALQIQP